MVPVIPRMPLRRPGPKVGGVDKQGPTEPADRTGRTDGSTAESAQGDAADDEASANEARLRYRRRGVEWLDPDERIGPVLEPGERLLAVRRSVVVCRNDTLASVAPPVVVDLYVTSRRLALAGTDMIFFDLTALDEAVVSQERLLIVLRDGVGLDLEVAQPRLLRVDIAAARAARRCAAGLSRGHDTVAPPPPDSGR